MKISIIGTSKITDSHLRSILKNKIKIISISSTREKSKRLKKLSKKFKIKKSFSKWTENIKYAKKNNSNFLICGRIEDNFKVLKKCCETGKKILIEKPVFIDPKKFNTFLKYRKQIFVGYNRIFYKNIIFLKKELKNKNKLSCIVKCTESSRKSILTNSCHIISILFYLFGDLKLIKKIKFKKNISCLFQSKKKDIITINFSLKNSDNFSIEVFDENKRYHLAPIEKLSIFKNLETKKIFNNKVYLPKIFYQYDEIKMSKSFKPGFNKQIQAFKKFERKKNIFNNILFAKKIMSICNKIIK